MKLLKLFLLFPILILSACVASNIDTANENLKRGMSKSQVEAIMGLPHDVQEKGGNREDWIYIGYAPDGFRNIRLIFVNDKYMLWRPAGKNSGGEAAYNEAVINSFRDTQRQLERIQTQNELNRINSNLNSINSTLRGY